jgi:hypothetical protein
MDERARPDDEAHIGACRGRVGRGENLLVEHLPEPHHVGTQQRPASRAARERRVRRRVDGHRLSPRTAAGAAVAQQRAVQFQRECRRGIRRAGGVTSCTSVKTVDVLRYDRNVAFAQRAVRDSHVSCVG